MSTEPILEPCPWCGAELYDAVVWDPEHKSGVCWSCRRCVTVGHDCEDGRRLEEISVVLISGTTCEWAMVDEDGNLYPHEIKARKRVTGAGELYDGDYCYRHARMAVEWAKAGVEVNV